MEHREVQELIKTLVDPSSILTLAFPRDINEFIQGLAHNYIVYFDNISIIPEWISDILCRAVTGSGFSKRMLYSDDDDIIYNFKRCIGFNGINLAATKADLLDRGLIIQLSKISKDKRRENEEIWAEFEIIRPKLLGYIFDILVKILATISSVKLSELPRMADFAKVCETISRCLGNEPDVFIKAYERNIQLQTEQVLESNIIAPVILKLMDDKQEWVGSATALLSNMETLAATMKVNTKSRAWPKGPNILIRRLNEVKATLEDVGIFITRGLDTQSKVKTVEIRKKALLPLPSLQGEKCAQITSGSGNDIGNDTLPSTEISLLKEEQKHAQIGECNASNDSNDTLRGYESYNKNIFPNRYVAFDFEWSQESSSTLLAAAFVDSDGNTKALHISEYSCSTNPEAEFIKMINQELLKYDFSMGWYTTGTARYHEDTQEYLDGVDSDLSILHNRCLENGVYSIVEFNSVGIPYIRNQRHIDLYNVFGKPIVQAAIFKNAYRTLKLDEVSKVILGSTSHGLGKYKGLTGKDLQSLHVEEQKNYVLRDTKLVMRLSKHNNGEVLDAMKSISEITELDFEKVCKTGISTWWTAVFDNIGYDGKPVSSLSFGRTDEKLLKYIGGLVLQPKKGLYHNLIVADVASLYPTMAILYNISFDTVNCECCRNDVQSRITNKDIIKDCKLQKEYWICKQKEGAFPKKLKIFKEERLRQKNLGNQVKQLALKILINGGYGVFGSQYFKYYDPRVAELIAAYGRYTISKMKYIAHNIGFQIVYGDTDSLFLNYVDNSNAVEVISKFKEECNKQLGVEVEHAKTYQTAIISEKKKHYIGWTGIEGRELDIVGMEGDKNDRPRWINIVFRQIAHDILVSSNPIDSLKRAVVDLELGNVNPELLKRSTRLSKNPEEYENENDRKRKIGLAIGARKGDVIEYFETDKNREGYSLNPQDISIKKYKIMLWKAIKDILEIAGYDIATVERELFESDTIGHMAMPSRGVAGITSYTSLVSGANQVAKNDTGGDI